MRPAGWDAGALLDWYRRLGDRALGEHCGALLADARKDQCAGCGYARFRLARRVDGAYYERLTRCVARYFPRQRAEWRRVARHVNALARTRPVRAVDIGCGSGVFFRHLDQRVARVGVDFEDYRDSPDAFPFRAADLNGRFDLPEGDVYTAFHVMEHVERPELFVASIFAAARPGARIFVSVPNSQNYRNRIVPDPLNQPPHHLGNFTRAALENLFSGLDAEVRIDPVERIAFPRILARLRQQAGGRLTPDMALAAVRGRLRAPYFSHESFLVSAVKRGDRG